MTIQLSRRFAAVFALLLGASPAQAFDCAFYQQCCMEYVGALEEAGARQREIAVVENTCLMHHNMHPAGARHLFCIEAWESMSREIFSQYQRGIIGFYPDSCMAGPDELDD